MGENEKVQIIVAMTLAGHPPREIMKVVDYCRQYIDKIKRKYKNELAEITAEQNSKRAVLLSLFIRLVENQNKKFCIA